jgi:hypothetical protein
VAFVKFSRDKRGYEHLYLVQPNTRRGKGAPLLYWYRTPPNIRVGRGALDEFARRTLERRYPDVTFDWEALANTPIPPPAPDVEKWRERRRQEKAVRQAARAEAELEAGGEAVGGEGEAVGGEGEAVRGEGDTVVEDTLAAPGEEPAEAAIDATAAESAASEPAATSPQPRNPPFRFGRHRRRRRGTGGR